jgi:hypothetical protein
MDLEFIAPLSHSAFVSQVLVPEAALSLIQQDLQQTKEEALATMRESAPYGVALFPDDSRALSGTKGISEADRIMQHRANARRKELEEFETSMEDLIVPIPIIPTILTTTAATRPSLLSSLRPAQERGSRGLPRMSPQPVMTQSHYLITSGRKHPPWSLLRAALKHLVHADLLSHLGTGANLWLKPTSITQWK